MEEEQTCETCNDLETPTTEGACEECFVGSFKNWTPKEEKMEKMVNFPWKDSALAEWSIVGMNHYQVDGEKRLFVAMTKDGHCIKEEGEDDHYLWNRLIRKAWRVD